VRIELADAASLDAFLDVVEEAARWLWSRGIPQWEPGTNRAQRPLLARSIEHGTLVAARDGDGIVGGCVLSTIAPSAWRDRSARALYLSKLVVTRAHAGGTVAPRILRFAAAHARDVGHTLLRLDCWDGSTKLRGYYRDAGFTELEAAEEHGYRVRLFERSLG
jgi:GNAT superfamily N-acetyltransferase